MAYAISAWFDAKTENLIRNAWRRLAQENVVKHLYEGLRPHITLAVYEQVELPPLVEALNSLAKTLAPFPVAFPGLGIFKEPIGAVYLVVTPNERLWELHRGVHGLLPSYGSSAKRYYLPDQWNPHCSLALPLAPSDIPRAVAVCLDVSLPPSGTINRIGVIDTPAEVELHEIFLAARS